jgi:threonylcarbamoyladenosine tRNA methylthiotransferase MtaB
MPSRVSPSRGCSIDATSDGKQPNKNCRIAGLQDCRICDRHQNPEQNPEPVKYAVVTFGCRVNQSESLELDEELRAAGAHAAAPGDADVVVINTCSVTAAADQGARQTIRRIARENPSARIVVTGCYATSRPGDIRELPNVVSLVANDEKSSLAARIIGDPGPTTAERYGSGDGSCGAAIEPGMAGRTAYTLRVQTGCGESCAYCIIPATRGRARSVPLAALLADADRVEAAGFKEIVLTGVHLGSYGRDLIPSSSLTALLHSLAARKGSALWRISSLEPMDCGPDVVDLVRGASCFAPHFHLPLQHASRRVLERMRRPYTPEAYASLVSRIRAGMPDAAIGSDVIVGFPGERDEDFDCLTAYLERSPLTHLHVFPYSDRPGTEASSMTGKIPGAVVRERARRVREIGERLRRSFHQGQVGTIHRGLTLEDGSLVVTDNYLKIRIAPGRQRNEWVTVKIIGAAPRAPTSEPAAGLAGEVLA